MFANAGPEIAPFKLRVGIDAEDLDNYRTDVSKWVESKLRLIDTLSLGL